MIYCTLHYAARKNCKFMVKLLTDPALTLNINQQNHIGETALQLACAAKDLTIVRLLSKHRANINILNNEKNAQLMIFAA
jgi:ankyrin repeat protein